MSILDFIDIVQREEDCSIVIYGCSQIGLHLMKQLKRLIKNNKILLFDKDPQKQGKRIDGIYVVDSEFLIHNSKSLYFIICSNRYADEMMDYLRTIKINSEQILLAEQVLNEKQNVQEMILAKRRPRKDIRLVTDLAEHCNLNCQSCDHFSPLAKEAYTDILEFEKEMKKMSEIVGNNLSVLSLEGGEPLLNKEIDKFLGIARNFFPFATIKIITNGILLKNMPAVFWEECRKNDILIETTVYPINLNYEELKEIANSKGVHLRYYNEGEKIKKTWKKPLDIDGMQNKYESFEHCLLANGYCAMLKHGKLYPCTMLPNLESFNKFYGTNMLVSSKDYLEIEKLNNIDEIYDFLCNPVPACRYCKAKEYEYGIPWKQTSYDISEWI